MPVDNRKFTEKYGTYDFYKSPDGEDCIEKIYYCTKYSTLAGLFISFYETVWYTRPTTVHGVLGRFGRFTFPFAGMGFAFGTSLCLLGQIRKKSDVPNHVMAAAAAGAVWGVKYRSIQVGSTWAFVLAICAGMHKAFKQHSDNTLEMRGPLSDYHNPLFDLSIKMYEDPGRPDTP